MLWEDTPRMIWRDSEYIARLWGLNCVEVRYEGKIYTVSIIDGPKGYVLYYGCVTKA